MRPRPDEPITHRPVPPPQDSPPARGLRIPPVAFLGIGLLLGAGPAWSLKPAEVREVEKVVEKPAPAAVAPAVDKPTTPATAVTECPTVKTIIQRIVTVDETKAARPTPPTKPKHRPRPIVRQPPPVVYVARPPDPCDLGGFQLFCR